MVRKTMAYGLAALTASRAEQRRFYLVRLAASAGEIKGRIRAYLDRASGSTS